MRQIQTQVDIAADIQQVWRALVDLQRYPQWNPLFPTAHGTIATQEVLDIQIRTPGTTATPYQVRILEVNAPHRLVWLGRFHLPWLIDGLHTFELIPLENGHTRVLNFEQFRGVLVPFVWKSFLTREIGAGFVQLNQCLKKHVEALAAVAA